MSIFSGLPWGVTEKQQRSKPEPGRPSAEWGRQAVELAATIGKTRKDIEKHTGRDSKTIERLVGGKGSLVMAHAVLDALRDWGLDASKLPPLDDSAAIVVAPGLREWLALGERLLSLATPKRFAAEVSRVRDVVRAYEIVVEGEAEAAAETEAVAPKTIAQGTSDEHPLYKPRRRS